MRPDMKEVIIERPRNKGKFEYKNFRHSKAAKNQPLKEGMKKPYGWEHRHQNDVIGPLINYLKSHVGEPWDDVWHDICENNDNRSVIGSHLRDHVKWVVETNVKIDENGNLTFMGRRWWGYRGAFYVHPATGLLCYIPNDGRIKRDKPKSKIVRMYGLEYYQHEGIWYEVVTRQVTDKDFGMYIFYVGPFDVFGNNPGWYSSPYNERVVIISKKQVGKRIIKKIKKYLEENNDR